MFSPNTSADRPGSVNASLLQARLEQQPGIHAVTAATVKIHGQDKTVFWLSGPGSLALSANPPQWVGPGVQLLAVTQAPTPHETATLPVWTPAALEHAEATVRRETSDPTARLVMQSPIGSLVAIPGHDSPADTAASDSTKPLPSIIGRSRGKIPALSDGGPQHWPEGFPRDCVEALTRAATSDAQAVIYQPDGQITRIPYAALQHEALRVLAGLQQSGLKAGDTLLVASNKADVLLTGLWASILGGIYASAIELPDPQADSAAYHRLEAVCAVLNNAPLLLDAQAAAQRAHLPAIQVRRLLTLEALRQAPAAQARVHCADPHDTALIILTSGSTGVPKGVMQSHRAILGMVAGVLQQNCQAGPDDVMLNWMPRDHVGAMVFVFLAAAILRVRQVHADTAYVLGQPERWLQLINDEKISITWSPNFVYELLARAARATKIRYDLTSLRRIFNGGEAVNEQALLSSLHDLERHGLDPAAMIPSFGMSETCSAITMGQLGNTIGAFTSMGPPVPGCRIRITNDHNQPLTEGELGNIQIESSQLLTRYFGLPESLSRIENSSWFDTGDIGFLANSELYLTGRIKDTLNVRGVTLFAHELENSLIRIPGIDPVCLAVTPVQPAGSSTEQIAVFFSTYPETGVCNVPALSAVLASVHEILRSAHAVATHYVIPLAPCEFPRTPIGKIIKKELRQRLESGHYDAALQRARRLTAPAAHQAALHRRRWVKLPTPTVPGAVPAANTRILVMTADSGVNDVLETLQSNPERQTLLLDIRPLLASGTGASGLAYNLLQDINRAVVAQPSISAPIQVLAHSCLHLGPEDLLDLEAAMLPGLIHSFNLAASDWRWALVDLRPNAPGSAAIALQGSGYAPIVALRQNVFLIEHFDTVDPDTSSFKPAPGLWLLIGGLGGVGDQCAQALQELGAGLLICGSTPQDALPDSKRQRLASQAAHGPVRYVAAADIESLLSEVAAAEQAMAMPLRGVIHSAGLDLGGHERWEDDAFQRSLAVAHGRLAQLDTLLRARPGTQCVVIASITGMAGGRLGSYAAQQSALISLTQRLPAVSMPTVLAFSAWNNIGLSHNRTSPSLLANDGLLVISPAIGRRVLTWALHHPGGVFSIGLNDRHPLHAWRVPQALTPLLEPAIHALRGGAICAPDGQGHLHWLPILHASTASAGLDPAATCIAGFIALALDQATIDVHDDFFLIGGDSISASRLAAQLSEWFFTDVPAAAVFQHPTANGLAGYLRIQVDEPELFATVIAHLDQMLDGANAGVGALDS
ncbi:hypothetical protein CR159_03420 [Pollutimonas subterranea]|uniref:Carrier domain-containing protein n=1 Tax=Pollutimonas subterranea TaxID=2045210 RepID=A0A2N4U8D9_9BURK|nr:AMP-binding protein [Pollutimonas subterranea]PLC51292.1 hypothetical protein CR159_03420 [Pollutimonas subterranea]